MASTPPTSDRVPAASPTKERPEGEKRPRRVRVADDAAVEVAIKRVSRDHRELIKDLAK